MALVAIGYGLLYIMSSTSETLSVKALNYADPPLVLPVYTAFLSNQLWLFIMPFYIQMLYERKGVVIPKQKTNYVNQYISMGVLTFIIALLRNIGVNSIPGSAFSLLISTSILFTIVLSSVWLKKKFNIWHINAALFCLASAVTIGASELANSKETIGLCSTIGAAFFISFTGVWQEYIQPTWDTYSFRLAEINIVASLIASVMLLIFGVITEEIGGWREEIAATYVKNQALVICVSLAIPILKLLIRNSKYSIINVSSAFFFEFVQSSSSLLGSIANILIFGEAWSYSYIAAFALLGISFALYTKAKMVSSVLLPVKMTDNPLNPKVVVTTWR